MVDVALQGDAVETYAVEARAKALSRLRTADILFRVLTRAAAIAVLVILGGVIISLIDGSLIGSRSLPRSECRMHAASVFGGRAGGQGQSARCWNPGEARYEIQGYVM